MEAQIGSQDTNDIVRVLAGEDKGKQGKVLFVEPKKMRAIVEGVNIVSRHTKPNAENPNGAIVHKEAPVHLSNLMLIDPKSGEPTRIGRKMVLDFINDTASIDLRIR